MYFLWNFFSLRSLKAENSPYPNQEVEEAVEERVVAEAAQEVDMVEAVDTVEAVEGGVMEVCTVV